MVLGAQIFRSNSLVPSYVDKSSQKGTINCAASSCPKGETGGSGEG